MRISDWSSDVCSSDLRLPELLDIRSPSVHSGMARIAREVLAPSLASHAMVEGTILVLLSDLCRGFSTRQPDGGPSRLTSRQLRAITEVIESERQAPTLDDLAALCGFSRRHLVRVLDRKSTRLNSSH